MYKLPLTIILMLSIFANSAYPQIEEKTAGSTSIESDADKFIIRIYDSAIQSGTSIGKNDGTPLPNGEDSIQYQSEFEDSFGIGISYKDFCLGYAYGKNKVFSMNFFVSKFALQIIYHDFKGTTLDHDYSYISPTQTVETDRNDFRSRNFCFNTFYVFSDDYSLRSVFDQSERQVKWDWSFMLMGTFNFSKVTASRSLIPPIYDTEEIFGNETGYRGGKYISAGVIPGLGINLPLYSFFFDIGLFYGPGYLNQKPVTDNSNESKHAMSILSYIYISFGYNSDNFYIGCSAGINNMDTGDNSKHLPSARYSMNTGVVDYFIGYKF